MKIKEVMAETELTDRAIRLYIDEGLVFPYFSENYKGRKSYDFSDEDINTLKNIATLRKAGFSIAEIKSLKSDETCRSTLEAFTKEKENQIKNNRVIYKILNRLLKDNDTTFESICSAFSEADISNSVPENTMTRKELQEQSRTEGFILCALVSFVLWLLMLIYEITDIIRVYDPPYYIERNGLSYAHIIIHLIACFVPVTLFLLNRFPGKNKKRKVIKTSFSKVLCILIYPIVFVAFWNTLLSPLVPNIYSLTKDTEDYGKISHHRLFPAYIPHGATDVEFFHRYRNAIDSDTDTVAEWSLPDEEYEAAKNFAINYTAEITHQKEKGDWVCIYFDDYDERKEFIDYQGYYRYIVFAYNDSTNSVRYIEAHSMWGGEPYYFSLDWQNNKSVNY